jgi:hypothetical protein
VLDPAGDFGDCPTRSQAEEKMKPAIIILLLLLTVRSALADGGFIPSTATAKVTIPDQRALIHFADGVQTLVIDTSLTSSETNLAWIIPLPAEPELEATTRGLFTTLAMITAPRIVHDQSHGWIAVAVLFGLLAFVIGACIRGHPRRADFVVLYAFGLLFAGLMLPALATAKAGVGNLSGSTVEILKRETVGSYDTVTIKGSEGAELINWLNEHGFETPKAHFSIIQQYARAGWVFVAARVTTAQNGEAHRVHPVAFRFPTEQAVYPLKLTGVNNGDCAFELFVFGDQRAEIPGWKVERCGRLIQRDFGNTSALPKDGLGMAHPELIRFAGKSSVGTKLSASLTPTQMAGDAYIEWQPFRERYPLFFSWHGARKLSINVLVCGAIAFAAGCYLFGGFKRFNILNGRRVWLGGLSLVLATSVGLLMFTPKVEVTSTRGSFYKVRHNSANLPIGVWLSWTEEMEARHGNDWTNQVSLLHVNDVRKHLRGLLAEPERGAGDWLNPFTGEQVIEEDSPGNYLLKQEDDAVEFQWFNAVGSVMSRQRWSANGLDGRWEN